MRKTVDRRLVTLSALSAATVCLSACDPKPEPKAPVVVAPPAPPPPPPKPKGPLAEDGTEIPLIDTANLSDAEKVEITTEMGPITLTLFGKRAPVTVSNFLMYVEGKKLDGATFYRAMRSGATDGFIQMIAKGVKYPPIAHESTKKTGLSHTNGTISTARYGVGTATNEFTISIGDMSYLDAGRDPKGDNQGFAAFGRVSAGMGTVRKILRARTKKKGNDGEWDQQMILTPIKIIEAKWMKK